jgi:hypothetical protein
LDNKEGRIMVEGWQTATDMTVDDALDKYTEFGVNTFPNNINSAGRHALWSRPANPQLSHAVLQTSKSLRQAESAASAIWQH